jgi:hypothetical protein
MDFDETVDRLSLQLTTEQLRAGRYLERVGQRFCVEFGYQNAVEKAREHWLQRRRDLYRKRVQRRAKLN